MTRRKPSAKEWVVHALDPKRSTSLSDVKDIVRYPLCGTADRGYGGFCFAKGPRFVTCKKCKKLLRALPVTKGKASKPPKVTPLQRPKKQFCEAPDPEPETPGSRCVLRAGHPPPHKNAMGETWGWDERPPGEAPWPLDPVVQAELKVQKLRSLLLLIINHKVLPLKVHLKVEKTLASLELL